MKKCSTRSLGKEGEDLAVRYLEKKGYRILERNYTTAFGEIDIIASNSPSGKEQRIVFIEVKMRRNRKYGYPEESITTQKLRRLILAIQDYLERRSFEEADWQIDVVSLEVGSNLNQVEIVHLENVTIPLNLGYGDG